MDDYRLLGVDMVLHIDHPTLVTLSRDSRRNVPSVVRLIPLGRFFGVKRAPIARVIPAGWQKAVSSDAVRPKESMKLGTALHALGRQFGGVELDISRDQTAAGQVGFE